MKKQRGYPDRRGMGAESDFISEQFVPSKRYKIQQKAMIETLVAAGMSPEQVAAMFCGRVDMPSGEKDEDR
jgi:hypothetical protein